MAGHMTGLSVRTPTRVRRREEETRESSITLEMHALIFARETVKKGIPVSLLMAFLSVGSTLLVTVPSHAKTVPVVKEGFVFSLTRRSSFGFYPSRVRKVMGLVLVIWIMLAYPYATV